MNKSKATILQTLFLSLFILQAKAELHDSKSIDIKYLYPVNIEISTTGINRINFGDNRITQIIGDNTKFNSSMSGNGSNLFITSKVSNGNTINLSVITSRKEVIDIACYAVDSMSPRYIDIETSKRERSQADKIEIKFMIDAMSSGKISKYYVTEGKRIFNIKLSDNQLLKLTQKKIYRYGNFIGIHFKCLGTARSITLSKKILNKTFKNIVAYAADNEVIKPLSTTDLFLILKAGDEYGL